MSSKQTPLDLSGRANDKDSKSKSPSKALRPLIKLNEVRTISSKFSNRTAKSKSPISLLSNLEKIKPLKSQRPVKSQTENDKAFQKTPKSAKLAHAPVPVDRDSNEHSLRRVPVQWEVQNSFKEFLEIENKVREGSDSEKAQSGVRGSDKLASIQSSFAKVKHIGRDPEDLSQERRASRGPITGNRPFKPEDTFGLFKSRDSGTEQAQGAESKDNLEDSRLDSEQNITLST